MKKLFLLFFLFISLSCSLFSQQGNFEFIIKPVASKIQMEAGDNFVFVSFRIAGIGDKLTADYFLKKMESTFELKKYQLTEIGKFSGFIPKSITADDMHAFLTENGSLSKNLRKL